MLRRTARLAPLLDLEFLRLSTAGGHVATGCSLPSNVGAQRAASQLVRTASQQQASEQQTPPRTPFSAYAIGLAAAAAAGAAYFMSPQMSLVSATATPTTAAAAEQPSAAAETAVTALLLGPLLNALQGTQLPQQELLQYACSLAREHSALQCWELAAGLWGLAHMLPPSSTTPAHQQQLTEALQQILTTAKQRLHSMPLFDAIITAWSLYTLDAADSTLWQQLIARTAAADPAELNEPCQMYIVHAATQEAARIAATGASASSSSSSSPGASKQEVEQLVAQLPKKMRTRIMAAYQDFVPFAPYIEACYMPQLALLELLPDLISTSKAAAAQHPGSVYAKAFSGLTGADVAAAATLVSDMGSLARLKRETAFHWRNDQLLDQHQQALNQVVYVLSRQMSQQVVQAPDVDILLPVRRAALFLKDTTSSFSSSSSSSAGNGNGQGRVSSCSQLVTSLLRTGFSAPPSSTTSSFSRQLQPGLAAAQRRCFEQRGWRCIVVPLQEVEGIMGHTKATNHQRSMTDQYAALQVLLVRALEE